VSTYDREPDPSDYDREPVGLHSCSYGCQRPACIKAQRDELRDYAMGIYEAVRAAYPTHRMTFKQVMEFAANKMKEKT
jgi:hypothetical protein